MGAADNPLTPSLSEELPILSKLQDYGYSEEADSPVFLATIMDSMGDKGLSLLESLVNQLADFSENSESLNKTISDLKEQLDQEKRLTHNLKAENLQLSEENARMRKQIEQLGGKEKLTNDRAEAEEEQLRQWRAQSLHQLQELERMNQALRAVISRHTCPAPPSNTAVNTENISGKERPCGGYIVLSQALDPASGTTCSTANELKPMRLEQKDDTDRIIQSFQELRHDDAENDKDEDSDLHRSLMETKAELSAKNREVERLSSLLKDSAKMLQSVNEENKKVEAKCPKEKSDTDKSVDKKKVQDLEQKLESLLKTLKEQEHIISGLHLQLEQKVEELCFITDEKVVGEEALSASQLECRHLSSLIKDLNKKVNEMQSALDTRTRERDTAIAGEKQLAEAKELAEESFQKKCNDLSSELQASQKRQEMVLQEHDGLKKKIEEVNLKYEQALEDLQKCQKQLESAEKDVQELKALVTQLDLTREELVEKLRLTMTERIVLENQVASLEMELVRISKESDLRNSEMEQLHTLLQGVSKERDQIHAEVQSLKERLNVEESTRKAAEDRCALKAVELENLGEHLNSLMSDFKLVKTQLVTAISERENLVEDLKNLTNRLNYCEQVICAKEEEEKALSNSYDQLMEEHQQLKLAAIELGTQVQQQSFQCQNAEELLKTAQEHSNFLEEECRKLKDDLKEMEKQVEMLSRSLSQQSSFLDSMQREKTALISQLSSSKQTNLELEGRNTTLIRELAAIESNNQLLANMIQGKIQEAESVASRYRLEHERVRELEQLVTCFRAQEHQLQLESKDSGAKTAILKERLLALEEQVRLLQRCKDSQREEISRLSTLLKEKSEEESRRLNSLHAHAHGHDGHINNGIADSTNSKSKLQELELKTVSLAADLSKTASLYKDCFSRLQKAESQCAEQRNEYDHVLFILSKDASHGMKG
ncbi:hypothetical protein KP509_19G077800 [Ceratopteris richardii]|uniref:Uncharacterized protein n=1 Tax=Ceratopteris richardii TaxID=49495 RepID=A0A8T2SNU7_CERRI|nr:hypothetical protein KP509_19G077800 [Ceratopteris richardii]